MNIDLQQYLNHPHVKTAQKDDLFLFHYTDSAVYDKDWNDITRSARGLILDKEGNIIARPWEKFFNLNEMPETNLNYLLSLKEKFYISKKLDGSLGILYNYNEKYHITTKGSFDSVQAGWATKWIHENLNLEKVNPNFTYLFEIIYPSNKIVVDYKGKEGLVLLSLINKNTGKEELPFITKLSAKELNCDCVEFVEFNSLLDVIKITSELINEEGFVITYPFYDENKKPLKIKIKGEWYLKLHKMISNLTPLAFWEVWEKGGIKKEFLKEIPEEFRETSDQLANSINQLHENKYIEIKKIYDFIIQNLEINDIKHFCIECQKNYKENLSSLICFYKNQENRLWDVVHKQVRPTGNEL